MSAYEYFYDRVSKRFRRPSLAELIRAKRFPEMDNDVRMHEVCGRGIQDISRSAVGYCKCVYDWAVCST